MNDIMRQAIGHPGEGDLVRLMDGELDDLAARRLREHLDGCARCMARSRTLERRSEKFSETVRHLDPDASPDELRPVRAARFSRRTRVVAWRAAAVLMVGLFGAMAVPQLRAWVADTWTGLGWLGEPAVTVVEDERTVPEAPAPADVPTERHAVSFVPEGNEFLVEVRSTQADGLLTVSMRPGREASAVVEGTGPDAADLIVFPYGIRVDNVSAATMDYSVVVPSGMERVRVRIGARADVVLPVGEIGREWTIRYDLTD